MVKTSPRSLNVTTNESFSLTCTVRGELGGHPLNTTIKWILVPTSFNGMETVFNTYIREEYSSSLDQFPTPAVLEYQVVAGTMKSGTFIYRCEATALNTTSFSDSTVFVNSEAGKFSVLTIIHFERLHLQI